MADFFKGKPILSWVVDDFEQFNSILARNNFDLDSYIKSYQKSYFSDLQKIIFDSPISLNLGGETKKNKLIATDKPTGIFNFSLASKTLFPLSEFYSEKLEKEDPQRFADLNVLSGIVPNILVDSIMIGGEKAYFYKDEKGIEYPCVKRIKGETAIMKGVPNAKKEYKSKTKKVFQTYKKKGGKVKYVEIYSLFYYTSMGSELQFGIRHLPAMMVADYLESIGIKVRIYMTRFVVLDSNKSLRQKSRDTKSPLPMYFQPIVSRQNNEFQEQLMIQPIIAKEFQQEVHNPLAYLISSNNYDEVYKNLAKNTLYQETNSPQSSVFGDPDFEQIQYLEGFERYRNKYVKYVKDGLFKSKEILPEAMFLFHDMAIKNNLSNFSYRVRAIVQKSEKEALTDTQVNPFFNWWMKMSATMIKNKVDLINSNELLKDLRAMKKELEEMIFQVNKIVEDTQNVDLKDLFDTTRDKIFEEYYISFVTLPNGAKMVNFELYVNELMNELTVFSDDDFFPTDDENVEKRIELKQTVLEELKRM